MRIPVNGTPEFAEFYQSLSKNDKLYKELDALLEALAENPKLGDLISFEKIPKSLEKKYPDLDNLLRAEVNRNWRLLYTLVGWPKNKTVYVLMAMPHKEYDLLFGY
jgi:plasmid maintenance system killer protein